MINDWRPEEHALHDSPHYKLLAPPCCIHHAVVFGTGKIKQTCHVVHHYASIVLQLHQCHLSTMALERTLPVAND